MKRSEQLINIVKAQLEILEKYAAARRFVYESKDGYISGFRIEQNKRGHRKTQKLDRAVFDAMKKMQIAIDHAKEHETSKTIEDLISATEIQYQVPENNGYKHVPIFEIALRETIEIEEESGKFVYQYVEGGWLGEERDE